MANKTQMYPFLFEHVTGTPIEGSEFSHPCSHYIVVLATGTTGKFYDEQWMDNPHIRSKNTDSDLICVPDPDLIDHENHIWKFQSSDSRKNYFDALTKMKELWSNLEILPMPFSKEEERGIFVRLLECRSMHVQEHQIENLPKTRMSKEGVDAVVRIYESRSLDERWMICHEYLGNTEEAEKLRLWLESKKKV
jgi:hypothetical protein